MTILNKNFITAFATSIALGSCLLVNSAAAQLPYEYAQNTYQRGQHTEVA